MSTITVFCLLLSIFVVCTHAYLPLNSSQCPLIRCGAIGPAVCAKWKNAYQLFPHDCARFRKFCEEGHAWKPVPMIKCYNTICPLKCPREDNPVCATNGEMFERLDGDCAFMNFSCNDYKKEWARTDLGNCNKKG